jgi:arylsulfatase A-like enzyme
VPPCLALALFQAVGPFGARPGLVDRYATVDMSFRFVRDLRAAHSGETAAFYASLKANTLVSPLRVTPPAPRFPGGRESASRPPHIFLFVIDSLRRDYVSPYNPAVTFTPAIGQFAADSFVFERAMTRYAGTALAVPSIWAGSMLIHMLDQRPFDSRNALLALLDADGYRRVMSVDHIMRELLPPGSASVELDRGVAPMDCDFCRTMRELEARLAEASDNPGPVFSYTLPQNVHIAVASKRTVPEDHAYPGFFAPVAESVRQVDECFGEFLAFLRRSRLYDESIVILTADHGDSLGEEGRWGHAYFMVPEVMRIPLIIHVPTAMRARVRADLHGVSFSTDITPTLYALLGHAQQDLGRLFGAPLLVDRDGELPSRRRDSFLLASSYGAVYGMLRHNGRLLYTSDAMDGREDAYDLRGLTGQRVTATAAITELNRRQMTEQLRQLASLNHFTAQP